MQLQYIIWSVQCYIPRCFSVWVSWDNGQEIYALVDREGRWLAEIVKA